MNIRILIRRLTAFLCLSLLSGLVSASVENYGYPFTNRYVATVVGTPAESSAKLPERIPFKKQRIEIFPDRKPPEVLWYGKELIYSVALQKKKSPLIFLIAGTGAAHNGGKNTNKDDTDTTTRAFHYNCYVRGG